MMRDPVRSEPTMKNEYKRDQLFIPYGVDPRIEMLKQYKRLQDFYGMYKMEVQKREESETMMRLDELAKLRENMERTTMPGLRYVGARRTQLERILGNVNNAVAE